MRIVLDHDPDCPLGVNGLQAYWEAREALYDIPAEYTLEDRMAHAAAGQQLEDIQVCRCGATEAKAWQEWGRKF